MKFTVAVTSLFALFLCVSLLFTGAFRSLSAVSSPAADAAPSRVIVLDAGHGGEDGGAAGVNGALEKDLNLALTRTLADLLRVAGYTVVETRTADVMLYPAGTRAGHKKQGDLAARLAFGKTYPDCVFISIHMNTYPTPNCTGTQVWYSRNDPASAELAGAIQQSVKALLQPQNERKTKAAGSNIYILHRAVVPAVLVECGFLSTPSECAALSDAAYRAELALAIFAGVCENLKADT